MSEEIFHPEMLLQNNGTLLAEAGSENLSSREVPTGGLSELEHVTLLEAGVPEQEIANLDARVREKAERQNRQKLNRAALIQEHSAEMIKNAGGKRFFSARNIGCAMKKRVVGDLPQSANGWGDAAGSGGLKLPFITVAGVKHYDLGMVGATDEDRTRRFEELKGCRREVLLLLIAEVRE